MLVKNFRVRAIAGCLAVTTILAAFALLAIHYGLTWLAVAIGVLDVVLCVLARHARDRTGVTGPASLRLRLVASRVALAKFSPLEVALSDSGTRVSDITVSQALGEASALVEHMANDGSDLVAAAGLLAGNLSHAFGLVDFPLLARDGTLAGGNWERHHPGLKKWAEKAQIAIV
ncbi:hypothetical protein [Streptosporangium roseum]|uniref:hypothetical protein n=1 Tax=Streptosporangium roseum TaxID=2001 RepID=UPI00332A2988